MKNLFIILLTSVTLAGCYAPVQDTTTVEESNEALKMFFGEEAEVDRQVSPEPLMPEFETDRQEAYNELENMLDNMPPVKASTLFKDAVYEE